MFLNNRVNVIKSLLLVGLIILTGCMPDWGITGKTLPDARLEITLKEAKSKSEIYRLYTSAAAAGGYPYHAGADLLEEAEILTKISSFWVPTEDGKVNEGAIRFAVLGVEEPHSKIEFTYYHENTDNFDEDDWRAFYKWKNEILPAVFVDSVIDVKISRHPAKFTDPDKILVIAEELGVDLPQIWEQHARDAMDGQ